MSDDDIFLEHYGVKGMKWGVRRTADGRSAVDYKQIQKTTGQAMAAVAAAKLAKSLVTRDANSALQGYGIRGYNARKIDNKLQKKGTAKTAKELTPDEAKKLDRKIKRRTYGDLVARGAVETGVILGVRKVAMKSLANDPATAKLVDTGTKFLASAVVLARGMQVKSVNDSYAFDKKRAKRANK